jgi:hypothetical protein
MFKKPFNKEVGEERICKLCGVIYHTYKPRWRCLDCLCMLQKKYPKPYAKKEQYPFATTTNEAALRFSRIHGELSRAWKEGPEALKAHYDKQLKEIKDNGIMEWILDRRTPEARREMNPMGMARSKNMIRKDYPDTRGHYEY